MPEKPNGAVAGVRRSLDAATQASMLRESARTYLKSGCPSACWSRRLSPPPWIGAGNLRVQAAIVRTQLLNSPGPYRKRRHRHPSVRRIRLQSHGA